MKTVLEDGVDVGQRAFAALELLGESLEVGEALEVIVADDVAQSRMQKVVHDGQTLCKAQVETFVKQ